MEENEREKKLFMKSSYFALVIPGGTFLSDNCHVYTIDNTGFHIHSTITLYFLCNKIAPLYLLGWRLKMILMELNLNIIWNKAVWYRHSEIHTLSIPFHTLSIQHRILCKDILLIWNSVCSMCSRWGNCICLQAKKIINQPSSMTVLIWK